MAKVRDRRAGASCMTSYLCLVTTRPGQVPQLRHLECDGDHQVEAALPSILGEWDSVHQVEVFDGERLVLTASGQAVTDAARV